jgi:lysophospholipase L1-like esterase
VINAAVPGYASGNKLAQFVLQILPYKPDDEELANRLEQYYQNHLQLVRVCAGFSLPLVVAVQPEVTGRENLLPIESQIVNELGQDYVQRLQASYEQLIATNRKLEAAFPNNVKALNFYQFYNDFPNPAFYDAIHLTEAANQELAKQLYTTITNLSKIQIVPEKLNL